MVSRRNFLKTVGGFVSLVSFAGCRKNGHDHIGPLKVVFLNDPHEEWENVDHMIDHSLENGFSLNFRDLKGQGVVFGNVVDIGQEKHALDAQGYSSSYFFQGQGKQFTITSLRRKESGFALDLMEESHLLAFEKRGETKSLVINEKEYQFTLEDILLPENPSRFYIPSPVFLINGETIQLSNGIGKSGDLQMSLKLRPYHDQGAIELLLSDKHFRSCFDSEADTQFTGLEHIIINKRRKEINANYYNGEVQKDAYFRVDVFFDSEKNAVVLNAADKMRVPDAEPYTYLPLVARPPRKHEVEMRIEEGIEEIDPFKPTRLDRTFQFTFDPPLEVRVGIPVYGMQLLTELSNKVFEDDGKRYMFRYVAFDAQKIPRTSQPDALGRNYPPNNGFLMEILENPLEVILSPNESRKVEIDGEIYSINLKLPRIDEFFPSLPNFDFYAEVEKNGTREEVKIRILAHGHTNRVLDIYLDPDASRYHENLGEFEFDMRECPQRFFISKNKFSSVLDFSGDQQFSGLRKILIPDYEGVTKVLRPVNDGVNEDVFIVETIPTGKTIYQQVTLANRFNGRIEESFSEEDFGFKVNAEFGVDFYEGSKKPDSDAYIVQPTPGDDYSDQIKRGFILRIKSIERILRKQPF